MYSGKLKFFRGGFSDFRDRFRQEKNNSSILPTFSRILIICLTVRMIFDNFLLFIPVKI